MYYMFSIELPLHVFGTGATNGAGNAHLIANALYHYHLIVFHDIIRICCVCIFYCVYY